MGTVNKRILAVDDVPLIREAYRYILSAKGYEVTVAADGVEALCALEAELPDLVLLDIDLPRLSGWKVLEAIRSRDEWHEIPVVINSVLPEASKREHGVDPRYDVYLDKKATGQELLSLIGDLLAEEETPV